VGEVSAAVPLMELAVAARPLGTPAHHWVQTSCAAHPVGRKALGVAAKTLAASAFRLATEPGHVERARKEFLEATKGKPYVSPLARDAVPKAF
jgi:aminobenzoyl-glutamate utilization protein B